MQIEENSEKMNDFYELKQNDASVCSEKIEWRENSCRIVNELETNRYTSTKNVAKTHTSEQ